MRRPLLSVAILYACGVVFASRLVLPFPLVLGVGSLVAILALCWERGRTALLYLLIGCAGWTHYALRTAIVSPNDLRRLVGSEPTLVTIRGKLAETPSLRMFERDEAPSWRTVSRIDVSAMQQNPSAWHQARGRVVILTPGALTNCFGGQIVEVTGVLELPPVAAAEGLFDYRAYLAQEGIYYRLRAQSERDWKVIASLSRVPLQDRFREWAKAVLQSGLPEEDEAVRLEWALTLGWKAALTQESSEPFIRAATYHIFAVDGLRLAILFGIFFAVFRAIGLPRAFSGGVLVPLIWFYVALTGWPASAIRATVMLTLVIGGWVLHRPTDLLNSLFAAALIILVWEPQQLFQAGFQLSFLVVLCMILLLPRLQAVWERLWEPDPLVPARLRPRWWRWVRVPGRYLGDLLLTSFAAWVGSLPLVAYYFNIITPVSTPANIVAVPLCALVLMSNLASLLFAPWFPLISALMNQAGWFLMELIRITSLWFASWPKAYFYCAAPGIFTIAGYYSVLLGMATGWLFRRHFRLFRFGGMALILALWTGQWWTGRAVTKLTLLSLPGGYAIYCDPPGRSEDLLIDCGSTNAVQFVTKPFLRAQGVNRLHGLLLSHGDIHQTGGARLVAELFEAERVFTGPLPFRSAAYRRTLQSFEASSHPPTVLGRGDTVAGWTVLHPASTDKFAVADDKAIVLTRELHRRRVLLLSDLGRAGQDALLSRSTDLHADILIAGLPAKPEALSEGILDAVNPRIVVVCDSEFPVSARAGLALRERLGRRRIGLIYTRFAGAVTMEFTKDSWGLRAMNGLRWGEWPAAPAPIPAAESSNARE